MLKVFNDTARYINQGGKSLGSFAMYLEPWHADICEFIELKKIMVMKMLVLVIYSMLYTFQTYL